MKRFLTKKDDLYISEFKNAKLEDGVILNVSSTLTLEISTEKANVSDLKERKNSAAKTIELGSGNYIAGTDFPIGTYDIVAVNGSGNVISSNMFDGGLNEVLGLKKDRISIKKYMNADFSEETELTISGVDVKLIPSK